MDVISIDDNNYKSVLNKENKLVMMYIGASWCGPCKSMAPIIDEVNEECNEHVIVYKVNVDDSPNIAAEYGIRSVPTILFMKNGEVVDKLIGGKSKDDIRKVVDIYGV